MLIRSTHASPIASKVTLKMLRSALLILMQHRFVTYAKVVDDKTGSVQWFYELRDDRVVSLLRIPAAINVARETFPNDMDVRLKC